MNYFRSMHSSTGCSNISYYGDNCSTPCHQNCFDGRCDVVDGTCMGCVQGYTGPKCDTGCDAVNQIKFGGKQIYVIRKWTY